MSRLFISKESGRGERYSKVVQRNEGLRLHSAGQRREGRVRHISAVEKAGLSDLREGDKVTFDVVPNKGKESAENLRVS